VVESTDRHLIRARTADALAERQHRNGSIDLMARIEVQRGVLLAERQRLDAQGALAKAQVDVQKAIGAPGAGG
jgi:outer membrane protein TolC